MDVIKSDYDLVFLTNTKSWTKYLNFITVSSRCLIYAPIVKADIFLKFSSCDILSRII